MHTAPPAIGQQAPAFRLLSDPDLRTFRAYGVFSRWLGRGRAIFVVDRAGRVLYERVETTALTHPDAADVLRTLDGLETNA